MLLRLSAIIVFLADDGVDVVLFPLLLLFAPSTTSLMSARPSPTATTSSSTSHDTLLTRPSTIALTIFLLADDVLRGR